MSSVYYSLLTNVGASAMAYAAAHATPVVLSEIALGDGSGSLPAHTPASTALVSEVYRANIDSITQSEENAAWYIVELVVPPSIGDFWVREFRIDDEDGNPIYIGVTAPEFKPVLAEGMTRDSIYRLIVETSNAATINLVVDPSIVTATHQYVLNAIADHEAKPNPHPQYAFDTDLADHIAAPDPHPQYAFDTDLSNHAAAPDPHPQYVTDAELTAFFSSKRVSNYYISQI